ncbi:MAG TPA: RHS repeat-associated core domain-containing protein [Ktedonobacterales bacterium]|nr:RHS repeat-associated core domain-containing protein [Ktedonobacterales bacterium]
MAAINRQLNGGTYTYSATADALLRPTDTKYALTTGGTTLYDVQPSYDAASNVIGVNTTLTTGTDNQAFCYDNLERLTWAGSTGTPPCGGGLTSGSLTSANYTQSFTYDSMDRLTSGPSGTYTYGDTSHPDAATSIGSAYTAAYDAVGDMVCRAPTSSQTCTGTPTGASLSYDNEGRLGTWQNAASSPTTTDSFLYDGEGNRIEQVVQQTGVGETDTVYVGGLEEVTTTTPSGGQPSTSVTAYYGGLALSVNGTLSFLVSDGLGTATEALNTSGQVSASRLYTPYGQSRYSSGTFPTEMGFTGYRADSVTGLDFAHARYYDPLAEQFSSADTVLAGGLNHYSYADGSPETLIDPSGNDPIDPNLIQLLYLISLVFNFGLPILNRVAIPPVTGPNQPMQAAEDVGQSLTDPNGTQVGDPNNFNVSGASGINGGDSADEETIYTLSYNITQLMRDIRQASGQNRRSRRGGRGGTGGSGGGGNPGWNTASSKATARAVNNSRAKIRGKSGSAGYNASLVIEGATVAAPATVVGATAVPSTTGQGSSSQQGGSSQANPWVAGWEFFKDIGYGIGRAAQSTWQGVSNAAGSAWNAVSDWWNQWTAPSPSAEPCACGGDPTPDDPNGGGDDGEWPDIPFDW